jgi:hypothetical protein
MEWKGMPSFRNMKMADGPQWWASFQQLLDEQIEWPNDYLFKFIVPHHGFDQIRAVFGEHPVAVKASSKGTYLSVTATLFMQSSQEVIDIYTAAGKVDGVISL